MDDLGQSVVGMHLHRESILYVEQLHQDAVRRLVGIAEPGFTDRSTRCRFREKTSKTIATPDAPDEARDQ
jgi:hypothetical protein